MECCKIKLPTSVEVKVRQIADKMQFVQYLFETWHTANVKIDSSMLPLMLNVLPVTGTMEVSTQIKDYPNCMFAFMDKIELDSDGNESNDVVERCKAYAKEFIMRVNASGLFEPINGEVPYSVFYDRLDVNVAGVTIEVRLKEIKGLVMCPGKSIEKLLYGISE